MEDARISLLKLGLGVVTFLLIGWIGARDKRIGGALLTFPLLNSIAMLTGLNPGSIAATVYLVIMWNSALFLLVIYQYRKLPPIPLQLNYEAKILIRVIVWIAVWAAGSGALVYLREDLPSGAWLFAFQLLAVACYVKWLWRPPLPQCTQTFRALWLHSRGLIRVLCFIGAFGILLLVAHLSWDAKWVAWASALPIAGLFALATLSITQKEEDLLSLGDTVLMGPLMVIPFNWLLSIAIDRLRINGAGTLAEIATVLSFWVIAAGLVFGFVPMFARWRDHLSAIRSDERSVAENRKSPA